MPTDADLILVGGGLANGLIAWCLQQSVPHWRVLVLEAGPTLGGQHTWSFHDGDLSASQHRRLDGLVSHRWAGHEVIFPSLSRRLAGGYASITSERFDAQLRHTLPSSAIRCHTRVASVGPETVVLADASVLRARAVIDARGPSLDAAHLTLGWQKFVGQELQLAAPHGLSGPVLMDASVDQLDGYRFVYLLPFAADRVLVEDTFYADTLDLDADRLRVQIAAYAAARGWQVRAVVREEQGVLPIILDGQPHELWADAHGVTLAGVAAALFHPTTGYSLPEAMRLAERIESLVLTEARTLDARRLFEVVRDHAIERWQSGGYFRMLNRMLFRAAVPSQRWRVMQRFYGLPEPLIARFYAGRLTVADRLRIVAGRPPVPIGAALKAVLGRATAIPSPPASQAQS